MQISPDFSLPGLALALLLAILIMVVAPRGGKRAYDRLRRTRETDPKGLTRHYIRSIVGSWLAAGVAAAAVWVSPGVTAADLGLTAPAELGWTVGVVSGMVFCTFVVALLIHYRIRINRRIRSGHEIPGPARYGALLPRTPAERALALGLAVTAGVTEEIVYRGLLIALGVDLGLGLYGAAALTVVMFGFAHLYQGRSGVLLIGYTGAVLTGLYLYSGSLLLPIIAHVLLDIRGLVVLPAPPPAPATAVRNATA
jgi:membrane protease YdiL (CAAX protease family)